MNRITQPRRYASVYNHAIHWGAYITDARTRAGFSVEELAARYGFGAALIND